MMLRVVRGGLRRGDSSQRIFPDLDELSNDPAARRRELSVVLELCAAWERGARSMAECRRTHDQSAATVPKS